MKGVEEFTEDFVKLIQLGVLVVSALSIFLMYVSYNVTVYAYETQRESYVLGDTLLSDPCLAVIGENKEVIKGLFSESNLDAMVLNPACIKYRNGRINVTLFDNTKSWDITLGNFNNEENANFIISVRMNSNEIKSAKMMVFA